MVKKEIEAFFKTKTYTLEKYHKGLTNDNYLLHMKDETYIVRVPKQDSRQILNRHHEKMVNDLCQQLNVETIYFNVESGVKITRYVPNLQEYQECTASDKIERCAILMKTLHTLPAVPFSFQPLQVLETYKAHVSQSLFEMDSYEQQIQVVKDFRNPEVLCHNDWVSGNILFSDTKDYLIDYEYGASNDPLFDVTSFLSENQIFDETLRERFYQVYFEELNEHTRYQLRIWEMFHNVLWCYWAMMMHESTNDTIYATIAKEKYEALQRIQ